MKPSSHTLIELPERADSRGALTFAQQGDQIPFPIKRVFMIYRVAQGADRGAHAHRAQHQFLVMAHGSAEVIVDNGSIRTPVVLDRPNLALYAPPMLWLEMKNFSTDAVCMVLTSDLYSESDYVRDRTEFVRLTAG